MDNTMYGCQHGRKPGVPCPHCMGIGAASPCNAQADGMVFATADICPHGTSSSLCEWCGYKVQVTHLRARVESYQDREARLVEALKQTRALWLAVPGKGTAQAAEAIQVIDAATAALTGTECKP